MHIDIAWLIGIVIVGIITLIGIAWFVGWCLNDEFGLSLAGPAVIAMAWLIFIGATYPPFQMEYHEWKPVTGTVQSIGTRVMTQDSTVTQVYVFMMDGSAYKVDDSRATLVKVGDTLKLTCKREWQRYSTPGYTCRWNADIPALAQ